MGVRIAQLVEQWIENPQVTSSNLVPDIPDIGFLGLVAQLVEQPAFNQLVEGSNPS